MGHFRDGRLAGLSNGRRRSNPLFDRMTRVTGIEPLEARAMLSITPAGGEPPIGQISWNGHEVDAYVGRWIVGVDNAGIQSLASLQTASPAAAGKGPSGHGALEASAGDVVATWLAQQAPSDSMSILRALGGAGQEKMFQLEAPADTGYGQLKSVLTNLPGFSYVEPDFVLSAAVTTPNDPMFPDMWSLNNTGQTGGTPDADIDAPEAWDLTTGSSDIVVGVIDTGVDYNHVDLAANIWTNSGEIAGDGIDNDGNGFVDDVHGWDFVNDDNDPIDDNNHGTHTSGTIGAVGNNNQGVVGVNWNVKIMALKFLDNTGHGPTSDAVEALNYATMMRRDYGVNIRLTSNSWGGGGYSQAMYDAIAASRDQDMLFIAAAGNGGSDGIGDNTDVASYYPAGYDLDNVIAVAATDDDDQKAGFSNYGATTVDLGAPGVSVRSTIRNDGYANFSGTSMATPHVAGVAALAWSIAPEASYQTIRDAIFNGVDPIPSMSGITVTGGRLNALGTLEQLGMRVVSTTPARGEVINDLRTDFTVRFTDPYDPTSVVASDLVINGHPADSFTPDTDTITFHYLSSPIEGQGPQTITMADGSILRDGDTEPLHEYTGTFRYDALPLAVTATVPADGTTATLPLSAVQVDFNEPYDPTTLRIDNITLSQGKVTGFTPVGNSVIYDVAGIVDEGTLSLSMKAGAVTDTYGNPVVAYTGSLALDYGVVPFPTPLESVEPNGSLVYDPNLVGSIGFAGDVDTFTIYLAEGQALSVVADPASSLRPSIELRDPSNVPVASAMASADGSDGVLQTVVASTSGTYQISLGGGATTGSYTLEVTLNAAVEAESHDGPANDTFSTAQDLNTGFVALGSHGAVASVLGQTDGAADDWYAFALSAAERATLVLKNRSGGNIDLALADTSGSVAVMGVAGATNADEVVHQFVAPTSGTYFARVNGAAVADYTLMVLRGADFDTEPNNSPTGPLVDLSNVHHALGYLQLKRPPFTAPVDFVLDPTQSSITLAPDIEGTPFVPQSPGSLTTDFQGSIRAMIQPGTIQFTGGSVIDAMAQPGPFQPGNAPADYAMQLDLSALLPGVIAYLVTRDAVLDTTSGVVPVDPAGHFSASALNFPFDSGNIEYDVGPLGTGSVPLSGVTLSDTSLNDATLEEVNGVLYLSIPIEASDSFVEPNTGLQFNFSLSGELAGSLALPSPTDAEDYYEVTLAPGEHLAVSTQTPFDQPSAVPLNTLDPALELLDDSDAVVASDANSAADGKNALVEYTSLAGGTYKIHVLPTAGGGEYVLSLNRSPVLETIGDQSVNEGSTLSFTAEATDPDSDQLIYTLGAGAPAGASIDPASGQFNWTPQDNTPGPVPVTVIVTDDGNPQLSDSETFVVTVNNVAPIVQSVQFRPSEPMQGKPVSLVVTFTDPGILDTHTVTVDWGDGTSGAAKVFEGGQSGKFVAYHVYADAGHYDVSYTLSDNDGDAATGTESLGVSGIGIHEHDGLTVLEIVGTDHNDYVNVTPSWWGHRLQIFASFLPRFRYTVSTVGVDLIKVLGLGGNDFIKLGSFFGGVHLPAIVDGGDGRDVIWGGNGGNVLIGGAGNDVLYAGWQRDILIGGIGADLLFGSSGQDILIAGYTSYDNPGGGPSNDAALLALLGEWQSPRSYSQRIDNITAGTGPILGASGYSLAKGTTVFDDQQRDRLFGWANWDWYFVDPHDRIFGKSPGEQVD